MKKLEGKIAVITGGNSGIDLATAQRFVSEGAYVFITGRSQSEVDLAVKQISKDVTGVQGDVSNLADLDVCRSEAADGLMYQYPEQFSKIVRTFLETT
jgi:NAD(P)-dependent dehydrogenase (short-subunit alcohol dehydrogenase family)